ncbi:ricin-type beta-trefoil lectin domain protein [Streptomyces sp. NPDC052415]|uniref:ricin-type beta-trefoil lectin domain protein n=1 Tax=Streptomyces sp. NPDC052415 TaxID=3365690 RepID=UPI0037D0CAC9
MHGLPVGLQRYVTGCNGGYYQKWYYDPSVMTALRQRATDLCLTVRSGQPVMRSCSASASAAFWHVESDLSPAIRNNPFHLCPTSRHCGSSVAGWLSRRSREAGVGVKPVPRGIGDGDLANGMLDRVVTHCVQLNVPCGELLRAGG